MNYSLERDIEFVSVRIPKAAKNTIHAFLTTEVIEMGGNSYFAIKHPSAEDHYILYVPSFSNSCGFQTSVRAFHKDWLEFGLSVDMHFATCINFDSSPQTYDYTLNRNFLVFDDVKNSLNPHRDVTVLPKVSCPGWVFKQFKRSDLLYREDEKLLEKCTGILNNTLTSRECDYEDHKDKIISSFDERIFDGGRFEVLKVDECRYLYTGSNGSIVMYASQMRDLLACDVNKQKKGS